MAGGPEAIADGVWLIRGGIPRRMNVYAIKDGSGVALFDAGISSMVEQLRKATERLGGLTRIILGHAHVDHRGAAPGLGAPVFCHPDDRADAEGDGGLHYQDLTKLAPPARWVYPGLMKHWDGGPVRVEGTVEEGDMIGGFEVVHLPGHSPGQIALWRESDRLALTTDVFYTTEPHTGRKTKPRLAHDAFNKDRRQALASVDKLALLKPKSAWPGHADPVVGDVYRALEKVVQKG